MRRCLVTGAAGFVGSNLCKRLLLEGRDVVGVDDLSGGRITSVPKGVQRFFCDFADPFILKKVMDEKFDVIFHVAAQPRVGFSVEFPDVTTENNVNKTVKLLTAARGNTQRFVNVSSSSVYGNTHTLPTNETVARDPQSPYALQKGTVEDFCHLFSRLYKLDTVSIRPFNIYGPGQYSDGAYSTVMSSWIKAVKERKPLRLDGDGEQERDFVYIDDVVDVLIRAADYTKPFDANGGKFYGKVFNAGSGQRTQLSHILNWFRARYPNIEVVHAPARVGDVGVTWADMRHTNHVLAWVPLMPDVYKGLDIFAKWAMLNESF